MFLGLFHKVKRRVAHGQSATTELDNIRYEKTPKPVIFVFQEKQLGTDWASQILVRPELSFSSHRASSVRGPWGADGRRHRAERAWERGRHMVGLLPFAHRQCRQRDTLCGVDGECVWYEGLCTPLL